MEPDRAFALAETILGRLNGISEARTAQISRLIIAIAGPPGSGKSTLAAQLSSIFAAHGRNSAIVPMDGFHLDNDELDRLGLRQRKGAAETFDAMAFVARVKKIAIGEEIVSIPGFDRVRDCVIPDQVLVGKEVEIILVEGNYLLLNYAPWCELAEIFNLTIFVNPGLEELRQRLVNRWLEHDHTLQQAIARAEGNDLANARHVIAHSATADYSL